MKKLILALLYLFVTGCGTFNLQMQIVSPTVERTPTLKPSSTPVPVKLTATPLIVSPTPTSTPDQPFTLVTLQMSDTDHGWGVDPLGRIVTTSNGGVVWADVTPSEELFGRQSLFALNDRVAWVVSSQFENSHLVWRTLDGGISWRASEPIPLSGGSYTPVRLQFPDAGHGWLLLLAEDENQESHMLLFSSKDGGEGWSQVNTIQESLLPYLPANTTSMAFVDGQRGWLGGAWGQGDPSEWLMLKTGDGGERWGTDTFRLPAQKDIQCDGQAIAEMRAGAMAVEVICTIPRDAKYLFHHIYYLSENTGPEWHSWAISGAFLGMDFLNPNQGWMMVASDDPQANRILNTRDGGKTWKVISRVAWKQAQFDFITDKIGWAIVGNGFATALYRTEDTGKTWIQVRPSLVP